MDRVRFDYLLDAYGGDFRRWPEAEREAGATFAAEDSEASAALAAAQAFDQVLDQAVAPAPGGLLAAKVLASASPPQSQRTRRAFGFAPAGWALAACALLGVVIGYGGGLLTPRAADEDAYFVAAFEAPPMLAPESQNE